MKKRGLIVGGSNQDGIGSACLTWMGLDARYQDVKWYTPSPTLLNIASDTSIADYLDNFAEVEDGDGFDYVVYSAGLNELCWADEHLMTEMEKVYRVNVFGFVALLGQIRATWPFKSFSAVGICSDAAYNPMRGSVTYCSSKAAMAMSIKVLAREWSDPAEPDAPVVRVNGVAPGMVDDTPMARYIEDTVPSFRGWSAFEALKYERSMQPMGRRADKAEVAHLVADILHGPRYLNGAIVPLTGAK